MATIPDEAQIYRMKFIFSKVSYLPTTISTPVASCNGSRPEEGYSNLWPNADNSVDALNSCPNVKPVYVRN